jgi:hypothetical protein
MRKALPVCLLVATFGIGLYLALTQPSSKTAAAAGGTFFDTDQTLGNGNSRAIANGDLDGQNGPDVFVANYGANEVWLNDGSAFFGDNGQSLGSLQSEDVALGDVDSDKDLDALVANSNGLNRLWINNGSGQFSSGQGFDNSLSRGVALGDVDGDDDLDAFFANSGGNTVWLNVGGVYSDTLQSLGSANAYDVALADLDDDGDLDAFVANGLSGAQPDEVWINQGGLQGGLEGEFADSGQSIGAAWTYAVALGDVNGDLTPDLFAANWFPAANSVFLNNGGIYSDTMQLLGEAPSLGVALGDVDGDKDLDAFVTNNYPDPSTVWLNDGAGRFDDSGQQIGNTTSYDVNLSDLDGDGDLDAFVANFGPNRVYSNGLPGLPNAAFDIDRATNDLGQEVYYWAQDGEATLPVLLSRLAPRDLDVLLRMQSSGGVMTDTLSFAMGDLIQMATVANPGPSPAQAVDLTLSVEQPGNRTDELLLYFVNRDQGDAGCILCYLDWLARLLGFEPIFGALHHADWTAQQRSPQWRYYTSLFDSYSSELAGIVAFHPSLLWDSLKTLDEWTPAVLALADGKGDQSIISQNMVDHAVELVNGLEAHASPELKRRIRSEKNALDLPSFVGLNMDEAWETLVKRRPADLRYLPVIMR